MDSRLFFLTTTSLNPKFFNPQITSPCTWTHHLFSSPPIPLHLILPLKKGKQKETPKNTRTQYIPAWRADNAETWTARMWSPDCASLAMTQANNSREDGVSFIPTTSFRPCCSDCPALPPPPCCFLLFLLLLPCTTRASPSGQSLLPRPASTSPCMIQTSLLPSKSYKNKKVHVVRRKQQLDVEH
jgi:hypothetical protein